jgi:leucyl/phenylalanyl-tRNA--protein transferase
MTFRVKLLQPNDPPDSFPDPEEARATLGYPDGLIAIGGDLSSARLLHAYRNGIFPWYNDDQPIMWWSPDPRAILLPDNFHMSRSLARRLRRESWAFSVNRCFSDVIRHCASDRGEHGTWITQDMIRAYENLHRLGFAHSVEAWRNNELAGGVYGVRLGGVFFGESMFSRSTDGSKVALSALLQIARSEGISLIDCQLESHHLRTLGMREVDRAEFLHYLAAATNTARALPDWQTPTLDADVLRDLAKDYSAD